MSRLKLLMTLSCLGSFANAENRVVFVLGGTFIQDAEKLSFEALAELDEREFDLLSRSAI